MVVLNVDQCTPIYVLFLVYWHISRVVFIVLPDPVQDEINVLPEYPGKFINDFIRIRCIFLGPDHIKAWPVRYQQATLPIKDIAPGGDDPQFADPVVLGPFLELISL